MKKKITLYYYMRLISLPSPKSEEPFSEYNVIFTDDITAVPQSTVTLHSVAITLNPEIFRVTLDNNTFTMKHNKGPASLVTLDIDNYTATELQRELDLKINSSVSFSDLNLRDQFLGIEYDVRITDRCEILFVKTEETNFGTGSFPVTFGPIEPDEDILPSGIGSFSRPAATGIGADCYAVDNNIFGYGPNGLFAELNASGPDGDAIISIILGDDGNTLDLTSPEMIFGLKADFTNGRYEYRSTNIDGTGLLTVTTGIIAIAPNPDDKMAILFTQGRVGPVRFIVLDANDDPRAIEIVQTDFDRGNTPASPELFTAITLFGADAVLENVSFYPDLFLLEGFFPDAGQDVLQDKMSSELKFTTGKTGSFLGFEKITNIAESGATLPGPPVVPGDPGIFQGTNVIKNTDSPEVLYIQLVNYPLDCYDGGIGARKSIMQLIDNFQVKDKVLSWTASYPIPISLNNKEPISMQEFTIRILQLGSENTFIPFKLEDPIVVVISVD